MNDIDKVKQKLIKIRNRKKPKYNYTNVSLLPTVYENNTDKLITDLTPLTDLHHVTPELSELYNPYNNGIFDNNKLSKEKEELLREREREKTKEKSSYLSLSSIYRYFFPVKEGATSSAPPPLDLTNLSFWQLPCDFLNTKFYDNLIDRFLNSVADYSKDGNEEKLKSDRGLIQTTLNQMLMIILAYIMTIHVYYFVFMYKWECPHFAYLPGHGMYFGFGKKEVDMNMMIDFFLRDIRKPVLYCSYIYTVLYPALFGFLGVARYRRLCFVFIFVFMLCFVFITMKHIGLSAFSFVSSGKINPLVMVIVLCSVVTGIFFTSQANEDKVLNDAIEARKTGKCDTKTVSDNVLKFAIEQNKIKSEGNKPYYYSIKELINSGNKQNIDDYITSITIPTTDATAATTESAGPAEQPINSDSSSVPSLDPKTYRALQALSSKFIIFVNAIIRVIISMALLPVAQIFISFFFLYTTSGLGLIIEEGFSPLFKVMAHMNDNDGEDERGGEIQAFYKAINETPFFKWWINEYFISSMLTIFWVVKFITIPLLVSKLNVKIVASIILGVLALRSILRFGYRYMYRQVITGAALQQVPIIVEQDFTKNPLADVPVVKPVTPSVESASSEGQLPVVKPVTPSVQPVV